MRQPGSTDSRPQLGFAFLRPLRRSWALLALVVAPAIAAGCRSDSGGEPVSPTAAVLESEEAPYINGPIVSLLADGRIWVEAANPEAAAASHRPAAAVVRPRGATILARESGRPVASSRLRVGDRVSVWTTGPELRSMPPQVQARLVVVE